jgi:hypothetical protein
VSVPRRIWAAGLLGLGLIFLISVLLALLDAARIQEAHGGVEFTRAATGLRWIVIGEVAAVALLTGLVVWRLRRLASRLGALAVAVWGISLVDLALLAMGGSVPRQSLAAGLIFVCYPRAGS